MISWLSTFLYNRQQRVKIADVMSDWLILRGGIPQGSWLGPLIFLLLIDDLKLPLLTHKYVDDTTVSEILAHGEDRRMHLVLGEIEAWSETNYMNINCKKTYWAFTRSDRRTDRSVRPRLRPTVCQTSRTDRLDRL